MDAITPILKLECDELSDVESTENDGEITDADVEDKQNINSSGNCIICKICKQKHISIKTFIGHFQIQHMGLKPFVCGKCNSGFDTVQHLKEHQWTHRKRKRAEQSKDSYESKDDTLFKRNFVETENDDLFACDICGQCCFSMEEYDIHMRTHAKDSPYYCYVCKCSFGDELDETQHNILHHSDTKKRYTCTACNLWFDRRSYLAIHTKNCKFHQRLLLQDTL